MIKLHLVIVIVCCLSFSIDIIGSEVKDTLELPEEIRTLTSEQIFVPRPPIVPMYPLRAKKDGFNAEVWVKFKILQGKIDSAKVIFCSKNGYDLQNAALMSLKEHDYSKDSTAVNLENKWLYTKVAFGYGVYNSSNGSARKITSDTGAVPIESECTGKVTSMPELIWKSVPEYPKNARNEGIQAIVNARVLIGVTGIPVEVKILNSTDSVNAYGFNDVVLKAVRGCRFKPMLCDGEPMRCWVTFPYEFSLSKK